MCLVSFQVWAQNNAAPSAEEEIKSLEQERNVAILNGDAAALDRMTADDYTFITLRGELRTKSEIVKGFQSGSFKYESRQIRLSADHAAAAASSRSSLATPGGRL
jgi:ketosteroid isomerase-like protein